MGVINVLAAEIEIVLDWAERDVQECTKLASDDREREEAEANVAILEKVRPLCRAGPDLLSALQGVADVIEATYAHDEHGRRLEDMDSPISGADVVEALCGLESEISEAIIKAAGNVRHADDEGDASCPRCDKSRRTEHCRNTDAGWGRQAPGPRRLGLGGHDSIEWPGRDNCR